MRLLNVYDLTLEEFVGEPGDGVPYYAILSHVWGDDEVSFQEMSAGIDIYKFPSRKGLQKIHKFAEKAESDGHSWVWIDTCCIDKSSSAELSEAINSMFRWYRGASICYAYLSDVGSDEDPTGAQSAFRSSRWFTRGWTLQELLAPYEVAFLAEDWHEIGVKGDLSQVITEVTHIDRQTLMSCGWDNVSIAAIMSWAAERKTTRIEDEAYCLMGLFNVNMPLIYGEGRNAFYRLQLEIIKSSDDQSILAWQYEPDRNYRLSFIESNQTSLGMLAASPRAFAKCTGIVDSKAVTKQGISFDIEKQFVRLTAAITPLSAEPAIDGRPSLDNVLIQPTAVLPTRDQDNIISLRALMESNPRELSWKDLYAVILECKDGHGNIVIMIQKTMNGKYERSGSHKVSWLRAKGTTVSQIQTLYIHTRAQQGPLNDRGPIRSGLTKQEGAVFNILPHSGYMISHSQPEHFTPSQRKLISSMDMALISLSVKKAIGVVTPLVLFFTHDQPTENTPPFAIRFDREGSYGSPRYKISFRAGVTTWEDEDEEDEEENDGNINKEDKVPRLSGLPSSPARFTLSKERVLELRFRRRAIGLESSLNMCFETRLPWQHEVDDSKQSWSVVLAHNFGDKGMDPASVPPPNSTRTLPYR